MDKFDGFNGWRRSNGNNMKQERGEEAERVLVLQVCDAVCGRMLTYADVC